jgi:hypothetical protein
LLNFVLTLGCALAVTVHATAVAATRDRTVLFLAEENQNLFCDLLNQALHSFGIEFHRDPLFQLLLVGWMLAHEAPLNVPDLVNPAGVATAAKIGAQPGFHNLPRQSGAQQHTA